MKKKTLDRFINEVIGDVSQPFHIAFGAAKFSPTGKGEEFSSPCSLLGKLMKKKKLVPQIFLGRRMEHE